MPKKYIKGKDGKFKGSLPDPAMLPKAPISNSLPTTPPPSHTPSEPPSVSLKAILNSANPAEISIWNFGRGKQTPPPLTENQEEATSALPLTTPPVGVSVEAEALTPPPLSKSLEEAAQSEEPSSFSPPPLSSTFSSEPLSSFYVSSQDIDFQIPESIARKVERGDMVYFSEEYLLYTDSYGDNNASHYPAFPQKPEDLIDLSTVRNGAVAENINAATNYSELNNTVKSYFTDGGCAALALEIHNRLPGSKLGIVVSAMIDDPSDATAAHVYVSKDGKILDGYGITGLAKYDYQNAAGTDPDFMEVYAYDTTPETVQALIQHGCFGNNFNESSKGLIGKVAELVIGEKS